MNTTFSMIKTDDHITVVFMEDGYTGTMYASNPNYTDLIEAITASDVQQIRWYLTPTKAIEEQFQQIESGGNVVSVEHGIVLFNGVPMNNTITERMLSMAEDGFDLTPIGLFLINTMDNVSYRAVNELYDFLEHSDLPITEDGHFLAYKKIKADFTDIRTGKMDNSIGAIVEMPRNEVNEDKDKTCSAGLHFCARSYLSSYAGFGPTTVVVMVKINPRDVVSIPSDYNNAKGRACRYEIVRQIDIKPDDEITNSLDDVDELEGPFRQVFQYHDLVAPLETTVPDRSVDNPNNTIGAPAHDGAHLITPVDCWSGGQIIKTYASSTDAHKSLGINAGNIRKVCDGKRQTAGGYGWTWATPIKSSTSKLPSLEDLYDMVNR